MVKVLICGLYTPAWCRTCPSRTHPWSYLLSLHFNILKWCTVIDFLGHGKRIWLQPDTTQGGKKALKQETEVHKQTRFEDFSEMLTAVSAVRWFFGFMIYMKKTLQWNISTLIFWKSEAGLTGPFIHARLYFNPVLNSVIIFLALCSQVLEPDTVQTEGLRSLMTYFNNRPSQSAVSCSVLLRSTLLTMLCSRNLSKPGLVWRTQPKNYSNFWFLIMGSRKAHFWAPCCFLYALSQLIQNCYADDPQCCLPLHSPQILPDQMTSSPVGRHKAFKC